MEGKILIIDDEESILDVFSECFTQENFKVTALLTVDDIIDVVNNFKPDVVIIDYLLKGINGAELCRAVKMAFPGLPVAVTSALPEQTLKLNQYSCNLFIAKPFDIYRMVEDVKLLINNCKLSDYRVPYMNCKKI